MAEILQIEDLRLDLSARRVFRESEEKGEHAEAGDSVEIELGRLTFDLFAALAKAAPAALSTDDIVARVWDTEAVSDETIQQRVSLLRRALDQSPDRQYVQTVRGFGYRLATEPRRIDTRAEAKTEEEPERTGERATTQRLLRAVLLMIAILILLFVVTILGIAARQLKRWTPEAFSMERGVEWVAPESEAT